MAMVPSARARISKAYKRVNMIEINGGAECALQNSRALVDGGVDGAEEQELDGLTCLYTPRVLS
jgi:hypothetical protein